MGKFTFALIILSLGVLTNSQFKMAGHGKRCLDFSPFEPMKVCDHEKGLDCLGKSKKYAKFGRRVCACYGTFVYDKVSKECRRKVGDYCQPYRKEKEAERKWSEKCQGDGECSAKGLCVCKEGLVKAPFGYSCVPPAYLRGGIRE